MDRNPGFRSVVLRTTSLHPGLGSVGLSGRRHYSPITFTNTSGTAPAAAGALLPNQFHQHAIRPPPVEFAVEDLLPGAEVEFAGGDGGDDLAAHDLSLEMGVGIVFAGAVVAVAIGRGIERRKAFEIFLSCRRRRRFGI
jgi:hypothetical protein